MGRTSVVAGAGTTFSSVTDPAGVLCQKHPLTPQANRNPTMIFFIGVPPGVFPNKRSLRLPVSIGCEPITTKPDLAAATFRNSR